MAQEPGADSDGSRESALDRRQFLAGFGVAGLGGLAGCQGGIVGSDAWLSQVLTCTSPSVYSPSL